MTEPTFDKWAEKFLSTPTEPMSKELSEVFLVCSIHEKDAGFPGSGFDKTFQYQVLSKRAEYAGLTLTPAVITFLAYLTKNPGEAVMYLYALRYAQIRDYQVRVDMNYVANIFPMGFLPPTALEQLWDSQKIVREGAGSDNMLDCITTAGV